MSYFDPYDPSWVSTGMWQRRCDASLIASFNRRESEVRTTPRQVAWMLASLVAAVILGLTAAAGQLTIFACIIVVLVGAAMGVPMPVRDEGAGA